MKKEIRFGKIENQEDEFLEYSKGLSVQERLAYMTRLTKRAYGRVYEERLKYALSRDKKKEVHVLQILPNETLSDFYKRVNEYKDGHQ